MALSSIGPGIGNGTDFPKPTEPGTMMYMRSLGRSARPTGRTVLTVLLSVALTVWLTACSSNPPSPSEKPVTGTFTLPTNSLIGNWNLTAVVVNGVDYSVELVGTSDLIFTETTLRGSLPCQSYATPYTSQANGDFVVASRVGRSSHACTTPPSAAESAYVDSLIRLNQWSILDSGTLELTGQDVRLTFERLVRESSTDSSAAASSLGADAKAF